MAAAGATAGTRCTRRLPALPDYARAPFDRYLRGESDAIGPEEERVYSNPMAAAPVIKA